MSVWSPEQKKNAAIIMSVGHKMGMSQQDIIVGLMTAMQESGLRNVNYGDRDSLGLFQQRPSMGWGTQAQVTDPVYAAHKFFSVLKGVDGRGSMALTAQAQAVQRSAYPDAYAKWEDDARVLLGQGGDRIVPSTAVANIASLTSAPTTETETGTIAPAASPLAALAATTEQGQAPGIASPLAGVANTVEPQAGASGMQSFASPDDYQNLLTEQGLTPNLGQQGVNQSRLGLVNFAKQFLGTPYVWGGTNLQSGVDCSGLVQSVFAHFGVHLPRVSYQQANSGQRVALNKLKPGDLVAWNNSSRNNGADHISIYIGGGKIIEAPRPGRSVQISSIYDAGNAWGVRMNIG